MRAIFSLVVYKSRETTLLVLTQPSKGENKIILPGNPTMVEFPVVELSLEKRGYDK